MKYYKFIANTPFVGTESEYYTFFKEEPLECELEELAEEYRIENAERFSYLVTGWEDAEDEEEREREEEELEDYFDNCECEYFEISREEYEENS